MNTPRAAKNKSLEMVLTLSGLAGLSGLLIGAVFYLTEPIIKENKKEMLRRSIFELIPAAKVLKKYVSSPEGQLLLDEEEMLSGDPYYAGYNEQGELLGVVVSANGQGFQEIIRLIFGYDPGKEQVFGMKVLESKETPGLGDKIEKDKTFLANFTALDVALDTPRKQLKHAIQVVKKGKKTQAWQIDAITGATISSKAIGKIMQAGANQHVPLIDGSLQRIKQGI